MLTSSGATALPGVTLAWRDSGPADGRPVLALHGLCSRGATWDRFAAAAAGQGLRTLAPDLRGHGGSSRPGRYTGTLMRDDVLALLDAHQLAAVDLVGHSLGGHVAMLVAQHSPGRVRRLVLEDTPPPLRAPDRGLGAAARQARLLAQSVLLVGRAGRVDLRAVRPLLTEVLRTPDPDWWRALPAVRAPTLLVSGGPTSHVSPARVASVAGSLADCRLVTVEGAGHRVHSRRPLAYASHVLPFLTAA